MHVRRNTKCRKRSRMDLRRHICIRRLRKSGHTVMAQFRHWTEEEFSARFRKMLTVEQYRDAEMAQLFRNYLAAGPMEYMAAIFRKLTDSDAEAMQLALDFYGPMYLLYSVYDGAEDKESVFWLLSDHIDRFISRMKRNGYQK